MSKKYVIEIKPEYEDTTRGIMVLGARDSNLYMDALAVEDMEELNSDYINENYGSLQDEAYQRGLEEGKKAFDLLESERNSEYQRGLYIGYKDGVKDGKNEAWEVARKIAEMWEKIDNDDLLEIFGLTAKIGESTIGTLFKKQTASEAIEKLKAYEEKQKADDKIEVGDEVTDLQSGANFVVTHLWKNNHGEMGVSGFNGDCSAFSATLDKVSKTGRHFDIDKILEEIRK